MDFSRTGAVEERDHWGRHHYHETNAQTRRSSQALTPQCRDPLQNQAAEALSIYMLRGRKSRLPILARNLAINCGVKAGAPTRTLRWVDTSQRKRVKTYNSQVMADEIAKSELLWREYQLSVDLYKFYIDLVVKVVLAYYAITGGILSFYFTRPDLELARWGLVFPSIVSFAIAALFKWGADLWQIVRDEAFEIAARLGMGTGFELSALGKLLRGSAALLVLTGFSMLCLVALHGR